MMKKIGVLLLLFFFVATIGKGWHLAKDGFHIWRVRTGLPEQGIEQPISPEIGAILQQPFYYIGRGHQCYAFASIDQRYVLKLPRLDRYDIPFWLKVCQFSFLDSYRQKLRADLSHRFHFITTSFQIAQNELQEQTAILYLHLYRTSNLHIHTTVTDQVGRTYRLDLDKTPFILQEKIPLMIPQFKNALKRGDQEQAKEILEALLQVIKIRAKKGIFNKDPSFVRNFGLLGEKGVQIDIGSFYYKSDVDEKEAFEKSFRETTKHVHLWLANFDPQIQQWFDKRTEEIAAQ
jgi:hypothetical protein